MSRSLSLPWMRPLLVTLLVVAVPLLAYVLFYVQRSVDVERRRAYSALAAISSELNERLVAYNRVARQVDAANPEPFLRSLPSVSDVASRTRRGPVSVPLLALAAGEEGGFEINVPNSGGCAAPCVTTAHFPLEALVPWYLVTSDFDGLLLFNGDKTQGYGLVAQDRRLPAQPMGGTISLRRGDTVRLLGDWLKSDGAAAKPSTSPLDFNSEWIVQVAGTRYLPFIQRLNVPAKSAGGTDRDAPIELVVCALIDQERFQREAIALEPTTLVRTLTVLLLGLFTIPFLKLRFIGPIERMRPADIWLLGGSVLSIVALLVAFVLHEYSGYLLRERFDDGLRNLVTDVRSHTAREYQAAYDQLADKHLSGALLKMASEVERSAHEPRPTGVETGSILTDRTLGTLQYPLFEAVFYASVRDGRQLAKVMPRTIPTRLIKTDKLPNFKEGAALQSSQGLATVSGNTPGKRCVGRTLPVAFAPDVAPTTGLLMGTFSLPASLANFGNAGKVSLGAEVPTAERDGVLTLATPMPSLSDSMVGEPFQFVVLHHAAVFFQAARGPFRGEKIFESIPNSDSLKRSATLCDEDNPIPAGRYVYRGRPYRMLAAGLKDFPVDSAPLPANGLSLLAFYEEAPVASLRSKAFLAACLFLIVLVAVTLIGAWLSRLLFGSDAHDWAWPSPRRNIWYAVGIVASILAAAVLWIAQVWWLALVVAPVAVLTASASSSTLCRRRKASGWMASDFPSAAARRVHTPLFIAFGFSAIVALVGVPAAVAFDSGLGFAAAQFEHSSRIRSEAAWSNREPLKGQPVVVSDALDPPQCDKKRTDDSAVSGARKPLGAASTDPRADVRCVTPDRIYATADNLKQFKKLEEEFRHYTTCVDLKSGICKSGTTSPCSRSDGWTEAVSADPSTWAHAMHGCPGELTRLGIAWAQGHRYPPNALIAALVVLSFALVLLVKSIAFNVLGLKTFEAPILPSLKTMRPQRNRCWLLLRPSAFKVRKLRARPGVRTVDLREPGLTPNRLADDAPEGESLLVIDHVESILADAEWRKALLKLVGKSQLRAVALISAIDPFHYVAQRVREKTEEIDRQPTQPTASLLAECEALRNELSLWASVLGRFSKIRFGVRRRFFPAVPARTAFERVAAMTWVECRHSDELLHIRDRLLRDPQIATYEWSDIVGMILDAAEPHYRSIWDLCSQEEKLVLVQLAQEGLVNPKRTDVMRRLARRGLVRVDPRYALINDSFALFVCTVESPERVAGWETAAKLQTWRKISVPLYALAVVVIALVLYTEQSLLTNVIALATGAAGALGSFRNLYAQAKSITGTRPA